MTDTDPRHDSLDVPLYGPHDVAAAEALRDDLNLARLVLSAARDSYEIDHGLVDDYRTYTSAEMRALAQALTDPVAVACLTALDEPVNTAAVGVAELLRDRPVLVRAAGDLWELDESLDEPMRNHDEDGHARLTDLFTSHPRR